MQANYINIQNGFLLSRGGYSISTCKSKRYTTSSFREKSHQMDEKATLHKGVAFFVVPTFLLNLTRNKNFKINILW